MEKEGYLGHFAQMAVEGGKDLFLGIVDSEGGTRERGTGMGVVSLILSGHFLLKHHHSVSALTSSCITFMFLWVSLFLPHLVLFPMTLAGFIVFKI